MVKRWWPKGEFARNVLTVMGGTTLAQAIPVLVSPVLTRLYTPADLGVMAMYVSMMAIGVVVATGRYELAVLIPSRDREAFDLMAVAMAIAGALCLLGLVIVALGSAGLRAHLGAARTLGAWLLLLPLGVLLMGLYQTLGYWNNRTRQYKRIASSRIGQSVSMCGVQIAGGLEGSGSGGLILGYLAGQIVANAVLVKTTLAETRARLRGLSWRRLVAVAKRHRQFPVYMVPGHLANTASSQMPVLMLGTLFGPGVAGFYALAERVLILPSSIVGSAIGDVYRQQAAVVYNEQGNCRELFLRTARKLALVAIVPSAIAALAGPWLFAWIFGEYWREAGEITSLLSVMVFCQIVSTPLSQTVLLAKMHRADMIWQFTRLALSVGSLYLGHAVSGGYRVAVGCYVASFSMLYLAHSWLQYKAACGQAGPRPRHP